MASIASATKSAAVLGRTRWRLPALVVGVSLASLVAGGTAYGVARNAVTNIDVQTQGSERSVRIHTETTPTFTVFRLSDPMRVVVDISGGDSARIKSPIAIEDGVLGQISTRQFSADGFGIARVMVGFDKDVPYQVYAEGNAVIIKAGEGIGEVTRVAPPPVAPVDRVAGERMEAARAEAEAAAQRAVSERQAALEAGALAKSQENEARRVTAEAQQRVAEADKAKAEAAAARKAAQTAADKDRAAAQSALTQAQERLRHAEEVARNVEREQTEAQRLAAQARRTQSEAEQTAAEAQAKAKRDRAAVEEAAARAQGERREADEAKARATQAKTEAEAAQKTAEKARLEAERVRAETEKQLAEIAARQSQLENEKKTIATSREQLDSERRALDAEHAGAKAAPTDSKPLRCAGVTVRQAQGGRILIAVNGKPNFDVQRLVDPPRLVIDLKNTARASRRTTYDAKVPWAARVRLGDHEGSTRAVIDLSRADLAPTVVAGVTGLVVSAGDAANESSGGPAGTPSSSAGRATALASEGPSPSLNPMSTQAQAQAQAQAAASASTSVTPAASVKSASAPSAPVATVRDVRFERHGQKARIVVELTTTPTALVDDRSNKSWVLQLRDAQVPKELERSLDTAAYETVVKMVSTYQSSQDPPMVNIVANLKSGATQKLSQQGKSLVWEIDGVATEAVAAGAAPQTAAFATEATALGQSLPQQAQKRVNMRLKDADLVNVIRFIADVTGENIIVSEDVKGKVTVNLRNVPWEQALDTILKSRGYDKVRQNNIIRIATAVEIQQEREREVAKHKALIETGETVIRMITVNYAIAKEMLDQLKPMLSPRGAIQVDERTNTLVVEDLRDNIQRIVDLARRLDRQTPQVLIEARIVEASSNYVQELGIQWGGTGQASSQYGTGTGLGFPGNVIASGAADDQQSVTNGTVNPGRFAVNLPAAIGSGAGGGLGFIFGSAGGGQLLSLRLSALETNGSGRIISSPRIATLDNRTAKIAQGVDIPISTTSAAGTNTRFIPANLELEVTPHVTNDGTVLLRLKTSKNEPDFANRGANGDPTIVKKSAETEVMVRDGDTAVIGGIYTRNTSETFAEVPFFSKIPVLGWLFKKKRNEDRRAELLVFITPRIVNRESALVSDAAAVSPGGEPPAMPEPSAPKGRREPLAPVAPSPPPSEAPAPEEPR